MNRYKETEHEEAWHENPGDIIARLREIEAEIAERLAKLEEMVG